MVYDARLVQLLTSKSRQYPHDAVALSGSHLRSNFRQIGHTDERKNRHPNLFFHMGGVDSFDEEPVDIVQGFMGVLVRLSFFHVAEFLQLAQNKSVPGGLRRSDDFAISGYLERRNVTRRVVNGGRLLPVSNAKPSKINNLGKHMHQNAMTAARYLQKEWGIWQNYTFVDYTNLSSKIQDMIECESGRVQQCPKNITKGEKVSLLLDRLLNVTAMGG